MRFLAYAASTLVVLCSVITVHAAPTDSVTVAFTNQTVTDLAPRDASAGPTCKVDGKIFPFRRKEYEITIPNIPITHDIPHVCHDLWNELKKHFVCKLVTKPQGCFQEDGRSLKWHFMVPSTCGQNHVSSAYFRATKDNLFGALPKCK